MTQKIRALFVRYLRLWSRRKRKSCRGFSAGAKMNSSNLYQNTTISTCDDAFQESIDSKAAKTTAYAVIMLISLMGNSAIVLVVFKLQQLQTSTNLFIANMAMSDLLMPLFAMPRMVTMIHFGANRWLIGGNFGLAMCKLAPLFQDVSTAVSIQSLALVAADRFYNVFYPVKAQVMNLRVVKVAIALVWSIAFVVHSPYLYIYRIYLQEGKDYCLLSWSPPFADNMQAQKIYFILLFALLIALPLCTISALYTAVVIRLKRQQCPRLHQSDKARKMREKHNRAILQLAIVIVIVFVLCWTPFTTFVFLKFFVWGKTLCRQSHTAFAVQFIAHSISAINPCVYAIFSSSYRRGLKEVLTCCASQRCVPTKSCRISPVAVDENLEMQTVRCSEARHQIRQKLS